MEVIEKLIDGNRYSRPGTAIKKIKAVIVHYAGVDGQSANTVIRYFDSLKKQSKNFVYASTHYVVDHNGDVYRCVPDGEVTYHVGAKSYSPYGLSLSSYPNNCCLGIEMCHLATGFTPETEEKTAELVALLLDVNSLSVNDVKRHYDITGKICPKPYVDDESSFLNFLEIVKRYVKD